MSGSGAEVGISNPGWWGIEVKPQIYTGSFYVLGEYSGSFTAALRSAAGNVLASVKVPSQSIASKWVKHDFVLNPTQAAGVKNVFTLTYSGGATLDFNAISLFPPTWNNRTNGLRIDLMQALKDLNPTFLRWGGNNIEGGGYGRECKFFYSLGCFVTDVDTNVAGAWDKTIGDITQRPGRLGAWGYWNEDGLGLVEYLLWCKDLGMEPVLGVFAGLHLHNNNIIAEKDLQPFVVSAMNMLEFCMGDASTTYGQKRAALGYPEPFPITYIEIGNEDNLSGGMVSYQAYRFNAFYKPIIQKYPNAVVIASTTSFSKPPDNVASDYHQYADANTLASQFDIFDRYSTQHQTLVGEYSMQRGTYPNWIGAVAEAIFQLGAEKNGDKVIGLSYAPLFMNTNNYHWTPDLIAFNADSNQTTLSTSYRQIKAST